MILYTIYDSGLVFQGLDTFNQQVNPIYTEMQIDGVNVLVSQTGTDEVRIERIISSNPTHFINPKLQPGKLIKKAFI